MNELKYKEVTVPTAEEVEAQKAGQRRLLAETVARMHEQQNQQQIHQQVNMNFGMGF
jgi:hypothetical protein